MLSPPFGVWLDRTGSKHVVASRSPVALCGVSVNVMDDSETWTSGALASETSHPTCDTCGARVPEHVRRHFLYFRGIPLSSPQ
jgi:hypothetical protein